MTNLNTSDRILDVCDDLAALQDALELIYLAGAGLGASGGAAIARGALTAQGMLRAARAKVDGLRQ